jgi:flagellum-specific peptidoglycan hydrolase FlgJ
MPEANVNDRASIERLYPREDFEREAAENARAKATVHRGLRIVSPVDAEGRFNAERASRHVGEENPEGDVVFLAPFLAEAYAPLQSGNAYGEAVEAEAPQDLDAHKADDYRAFIDRITEAARTAEFKSPIGLHEKRLHGFHGG